MNSQYSIMQKTCIKISVWIFLLSAPLANADAPNVSLERHDEMIQWPAAAPWDGNALTSEYKDVQITRGATGDLLLYLPVTRTAEGHLQTLFRWDSTDNRFESITDNLNIDTDIARDTYDADFTYINDDAHPDIVQSSPHGNFIFINDGADNFSDETNSRLPAFLRTDCINIWDDTVSGDLDGDGDIDLIFANRTHNIGPAGCTDRRFWGPNAILYNNGEGVFERTQILGKPETEPFEDREGSSHGIEIADLNNDGRLDLIISRERNYGNGVSNPSAADGSTAVQLEYRLNSGDTDGDGRIDWAAPVSIPTDGYSNNVEPMDFDNDGDIDIFVARSGTDQVHLNQFIGSTPGTPLFNSDAANTLNAPDSENYSYDISVGDLNNDGLMDMAVPDVDGGSTGANALHLNDSGSGFERSNDALITSASPYFSLSVAFADVNADDKIDMVWTGDNRGDDESPTVLINTTAGVADNRAPKVEVPSLLFSAGSPAAANFRIRLTDSSPDIDDINATLDWTVTGSLGTVINAPSPVALEWAAKTNYQARIQCSAFSAFQAGETISSFSGSVNASDGRTTPNTTNVDIASFGASIPTDLATNFANSAGGATAITILEPTTTSPSVAQPNDGSGRLLVRVRLASIDLQPEPENFSVSIGGQPAPVITGAVVANEMWLVVVTPVEDLTSDLTVAYSPCGISESATVANAVTFTDSPIDTDSIFVVDRSGSMDDNRKMESAKNAGSLWADTLRDNERVGVVWYAGSDTVTRLGLAEVDFDIARAGDSNNRADAIEKINDLLPEGSTPLGTGLTTGLAELNSITSANRNDIRQIILLSDGLENVPHFWSAPPDGWPAAGVMNEPVIDEFLAATGSDVIIHTVSLGPEADHALMANIAALSGGNHVVADLDPGEDDLGQRVSFMNEAMAADSLSEVGLPNRLADLYEDLHNASTSQQRHWKGEFVVTRGSPNDFNPEGINSQTRFDIISFPMEPGLSYATVSVNWDAKLEGSVTILPEGAQPAGSIQQSASESNSVFRITNPSAGTWRIGLPVKWAGTEVLVTVSGVSTTKGILRQAVSHSTLDAANRAVRGQTILEAGSEVTMTLALVDTAPTTGATVTGTARDLDGKIENFNFRDDGISPDQTANDGVYFGVFNDTTKGGPHNVEATARWVGADTVTRQRIFNTAVTLKERDRDQDGISDIREELAGLNPDDANDVNQDDDDDGLDNWKEVIFGLDPFRADTDNGGLSDQHEVCMGLDPLNAKDDDLAADSDGDQMPDRWEEFFALDPNSAADANQDLDGDGLTNLEEYQACTGPKTKDSDDDGLSDGEEVEQGLDPNDHENRADPQLDHDNQACEECQEAGNYIWLCYLILALLLILIVILIIKRK